MSYLTENLLPGETIIFQTKKHVIIFFYPFILFVFALFSVSYLLQNPLLVKLFWVPILISTLFIISVAIEYMTSLYVLTNQRILLREGFFIRHANETLLRSISQVSIEQGVIGQILNYGTLRIHAFGAFDAFPLVAKAKQFQYQINLLLAAPRH